MFYIINAKVPIRTGIFKYLLCHHPHGFARVIILPAKNTFLFGIRTTVQIDELVFRDTEFPRLVDRGEKQRGRLVNLVHGIHILGIWPGHVTVTVCCRGNLITATLDRVPGMWTLRCDLGKPGKQLTQPQLVFLNGMTQLVSPRIFTHRIETRCKPEAVLLLMGRTKLYIFHQEAWVTGRCLLPGWLFTGRLNNLTRGCHGLCPREQHKPGFAIRNRLTEAVHQVLRSIAAIGHQPLGCAGCADSIR